MMSTTTRIPGPQAGLRRDARFSVRTSVSLTPAMRKQLDAAALEAGVSRSVIAREALALGMDRAVKSVKKRLGEP